MVVLTLNIYNNIWSYYILGRLTLQEGEKLLDIRLRQEGFERCSGQLFTHLTALLSTIPQRDQWRMIWRTQPSPKKFDWILVLVIFACSDLKRTTKNRSVTAVNWSIIHVFLVMDHLVNSCVVFIYMTLVLFYIVIFKNKSDKLIWSVFALFYLVIQIDMICNFNCLQIYLTNIEYWFNSCVGISWYSITFSVGIWCRSDFICREIICRDQKK